MQRLRHRAYFWAISAGLLEMFMPCKWQVRRLVTALRPAGRSVGGGAGGPGSARDAPILEAAAQLAALFGAHPSRRGVFLAEDGVVAIIELLEERSHKVRGRYLAWRLIRRWQCLPFPARVLAVHCQGRGTRPQIPERKYPYRE